jgi:hypothetical protein
MTRLRKGILLAAIQCALTVSLTGKLLYDRATRPRVWVRTAPYDHSGALRGRYLALRLSPEPGAQWHRETNGARVLFFVPEHALPFERARPELWAEVTIPKEGPPRPIRLGVFRDGKMEPLAVN